MTQDEELDARLQQARDLVRCLESGDISAADALVSCMTHLHESNLFRELGRLTRELHDAISGFLLDERLQRLARQEIPDATERLRYVIAMTEQSANTTLGAVEAGMPLVESLQRDAERLAGEWRRFRGRELTLQDFRRLSEELSGFLGRVGSDSGVLHDQLSEVLMAQGFQDLTGQIIRKVIHLVQDVEDKLVELLRLSGEGLPKQASPAEPEPPGHGPTVPGVDAAGVVGGQDEVDDLLSSLGF
jgi:chemotaxis protein CheZ